MAPLAGADPPFTEKRWRRRAAGPRMDVNDHRGGARLTDTLQNHDEGRRAGRRSRIAFGPLLPGIVLTTVGLAFLLDNLDLVDSWAILRFWPVIGLDRNQ